MPLDKLNAFTKKVQDLADKPNATMSAAEVKAQFDAAPNELRLAFNQLIDDLQSVVDGDSGADNIAVTTIAGLTGSSVQTVLESLKALDDSNRAYLLEQIQGVVLGQISDGSLTDAKLSNDSADIKQRFETHEADYVKHPAFATATGSANNYAITLNPAPTSYVEGLGVVVAINVNATASSTLNVNGLGAIPIKKANGGAISNLKANGIYTMRYNAGTASFILQGEGASGNAVASDLLSGKTASTDVGDIVGNMPNRGEFNLGLGVSVPEGYYSGGVSPSGKKFKQGTGTAGAGYAAFTVTGLGFKPSVVIIEIMGNNSRMVVNALSAHNTSTKDNLNRTIYEGNSFTDPIQSSTSVLNSDGFTVYPNKNASNYTVAWYAFE